MPLGLGEVQGSGASQASDFLSSRHMSGRVRSCIKQKMHTHIFVGEDCKTKCIEVIGNLQGKIAVEVEGLVMKVISAGHLMFRVSPCSLEVNCKQMLRVVPG